MHKKQLITVTILILFITSLVFGLDFSTDSNEQENINDDIISNPIRENTLTGNLASIDSPTGWSERETVLTDIEFNIQMMDFDYITVYESDHSRTFGVYEMNREYSVGNDGYYHRILIDYDTPNNMPILYIYGRIYCGGVGVLTYEQKLLVNDDSADDYTYTESGTLNVNSDFLDAQGYLYFEFFVSVIVSTNDIIFKLYYLNVGSSWARNEVFRADEEVGSSFGSIYYLAILTDRFYFVRNTIENQIRSEYCYVSDTMISHKLTIPSVPHAKEINVYTPTHWTYSSISPSATVTKSSNDYTIESPTELTYEILFTSNSTYLLAIEDVTTNYFINIGFEDGKYIDDITQQVGYEWDSVSVSTDVSYEGYHSLELEHTSISRTILSIDALEGRVRGFYFQISVYYEVVSGAECLNIYYYDGSTWTNIPIDNTIQNRWQLIQIFVPDAEYDGEEGFFRLDTNSATYEGKVYIDNIRILEVSTEIETTDLDEYQISSTFICWDGYSNPVLTNEEITFELWDRTNQTEITSYETTTNSLGIASWTYDSSFEQKEYMVRTYTFNNRFSDFWQMNYGYSNDFDNGISHLAYIGEGGCDTVSGTVENGYFNLKMNHDEGAATTYCWAKWEFDDYDDISNLYELTSIVKVREVLDEGGTPHWYFRGNTDPNAGLHNIHLHDLSTTSCTNCFINKTDWDYDYCNTDMMFLIRASDMENADDFDFEYHFDFILIVEDSWFSEFYFTPEYPYNIDFAEEEIEDEWDFTEGDIEDWSQIWNVATTTPFVENGSFVSWNDSSGAYYAFGISGLSIDSSYYTHLQFRIKTNSSEVLQIYGIRDSDGYVIEPHLNFQNWIIFDFQLGGDPQWSGIETALYIVITQENYPTQFNGTCFVFVDWIRLVHVEEPETFLTDSYLGFGSENDKWISAVWSDNVFLGYYNDPNLVYLNQTLGTHNISRLPVARQGETKAFLYSNIFTYTYQVSEPDNYFLLLNPPSYDIDAGLIYINLVTYYNNCTYRVKMNETFLGDAVDEGSSVWSCDFSSAGFYNFTVFVYQGAEIWRTLTSSITIPSTEEESLQLLFLTKDVDTSVSQIFVNYHTNWENTTLIVFDNSTQLGTELSGEGASIWSFSQVDYYAFHNISICIYHNSVLQFIYYFSFTIQAPALEPENYYTLLNPPSFDIDAGLIYIDLCTYYGNCTYRLAMNESWLGSGVPEGSSVWACDFSNPGFYNFTVYVFQGATVWSTLTSSITIAEPALPEELIIEVWNKDVDVAAGLIYINVITSWGNQSVRLQDNSTLLGDYASEGASIWLFSTSFGLHNISIWLYNDLTPMFVEYFSFTIQEPSLEIFTVHFDLFTIAGIGLPFETAKIYVNDSRIYNPQQYYFKDSFIEVKVRDYYNHLLFATNATITANRDIALYVRLFMQQIRNTYEIPVEVYFISTFDSNYNHSYIVAAEGSISVLLFSSSYHVLVKPLQDEYQNSTHIVYFYATTSEYQDLGDETKSYTISMETDLKPLDLEEPKVVRTWPAWVIIAYSIILNAILISFIGAMGKWGIVKVWNYGLYYPNKGANWVLRKFGSEKELHWCVEHKGGLEFVTPEQYDKAEALKEEGKF